MEAKVQPAADIIWSNGTGHKLASDVEADLVFCGLNLISYISSCCFNNFLNSTTNDAPGHWMEEIQITYSVLSNLLYVLNIPVVTTHRVKSAEYEVNLTDFTLGLVFK